MKADTPDMIGGMGKFVSRKGHNARVTGLAMLVFGIAIALASGGTSGLTGFSVLVAIGGLVTLIVGVGLGREVPNDAQAE